MNNETRHIPETGQMKRTWEISDLDGTNKRRVTLDQFRAELAARAAMTKPIADAWRRGDLAACEAAQRNMRS
jgi:hypothetical protein